MVKTETLQEFRNWKTKYESQYPESKWGRRGSAILSDYVNNFHMFVKSAYNQNRSENPTQEGFYSDIKEAVNSFGFDLSTLIGDVSGTPEQKRKCRSNRAKVFFKLIDIGYDRLDLIG